MNAEVTPATAWALECVRRHDPNAADGIEAALRAMKYLQSLPTKAPVIPIANGRK